MHTILYKMWLALKKECCFWPPLWASVMSFYTESIIYIKPMPKVSSLILTLSITEGSFATPLKIVIETDNGHYSNHDDRGVIHGQNNYLFTVVCKSTVANKRSPLQIQVGSVKINGQPSLTDPAKFNPVNTTRLF